MPREHILDIQKDIIVFLLFSKEAETPQHQVFVRFSEEIQGALASAGGMASSAKTFYSGILPM